MQCIVVNLLLNSDTQHKAAAPRHMLCAIYAALGAEYERY
jgi:hypothetical protein